MDAAGSSVEFFVPGDCVPWARAGGGKTGHRFTPPKQAKYAATLKVLCLEAMHGRKPFEGALSLELVAGYPWPKAMPAKKRALPGSRWRTSRPDIDNLMKIVGDALNKVAWLDDSQIAVASLRKVHSDLPGLRVRVEALA